MQETLANVASSLCDTSTSSLFPLLCAKSLPEFCICKEPLREASNVPRINHLHGFLEPCSPAIPEVATSLPVSREFKVQAGGQTRGDQQIVKSFKTKDLHRKKPGGSLGGDECSKKRNSHRH